MDEFELNPIGEETDGGEQENEDLHEDEGTVSEDEGASEEGKSEEADDAGRQTQKQSREFNAAMRAARQRAEKETAERLSAANDRRIADMRIPNPEKPGEYFGSMEDLDTYSKNLRRAQAEERAKREKRPLQEIIDEDENREWMRRKREEETLGSKSKGNDSFVVEDIKDFRNRYPDVDILKLESNASFRRFAGSRYGKEPLGDLYEDYLEVVGEAKRSASVRKEEKRARGSGGGSGSAPALSSSQKAALKRWNENNPDMKMTEKEFLERG